jgi:hypothetical protein
VIPPQPPMIQYPYPQMPYHWPAGHFQVPAGYPALIHNITLLMLAPAQPAGPQPLANIPKIPEWLAYCDRHRECEGDNLSALAIKFGEQGFHRIDQLTGGQNHFAMVEKLSEWLQIGKGTADLIVWYAEEDLELVKSGSFVMN